MLGSGLQPGLWSEDVFSTPPSAPSLRGEQKETLSSPSKFLPVEISPEVLGNGRNRETSQGDRTRVRVPGREKALNEGREARNPQSTLER